MYDAKIQKNLHVLLHCFITRSSSKKSERSFFDQVAVDAKRVLTFEKRTKVSELKLKT